jgi:hypothetical protein
VLVLRTNSNALVNLFTSATLMPAILYAATVLLYVFTAHRVRTDTRFFHLGRWEWPVIIGSLAWLAYELIVLIGPASFRPAQGYALGAIGVGAVVFVVMWLLEPAAMRAEPGARGEQALEAGDQPPPATGDAPA